MTPDQLRDDLVIDGRSDQYAPAAMESVLHNAMSMRSDDRDPTARAFAKAFSDAAR